MIHCQKIRDTEFARCSIDFFTIISIDCHFNFRPLLLVNALRCLHLLLTKTSDCQLTSDLIQLIHPLIHIPICESYVIKILSNKNLSLSNLYSCSSLTSFIFLYEFDKQYSLDDENKLLYKFLPDLICLYRNNEHDLSLFFSSYSPEYTQICSLILMKISSFDKLPNDLMKTETKIVENEFNQIEFEWSKLKLLIPITKTKEKEENFPSKCNFCQLNFNRFQTILEIYDKNIQFIQQLKDKHLVRIN